MQNPSAATQIMPCFYCIANIRFTVTFRETSTLSTQNIVEKRAEILRLLQDQILGICLPPFFIYWPFLFIYFEKENLALLGIYSGGKFPEWGQSQARLQRQNTQVCAAFFAPSQKLSQVTELS